MEEYLSSSQQQQQQQLGDNNSKNRNRIKNGGKNSLQSNQTKSEISLQEDEYKEEKEEKTNHKNNNDNNNVGIVSISSTNNPLIEQIPTSSPGSVNGIEIIPSKSSDFILSDRLRNLSAPSNIPYPASEIPNKVAYIAIQISSIQDLRT